VLLGIYRVEPQSSAYPSSFPFGATPDHWHLGEQFSLTDQSIFWFNFFPAQPYLFKKTFAVWALFQMLELKGRGENNQLVVSVDADRLSHMALTISSRSTSTASPACQASSMQRTRRASIRSPAMRTTCDMACC
jgi:hypothetical protein